MSSTTLFNYEGDLYDQAAAQNLEVSLEPLHTVQIPNDRFGKVDLLDYMGDDARAAFAAWVSFDRSEPRKLKEAVKVTNYLADHNHVSPFFHPVVCLRYRMPIFVARQWMRSGVGVRYTEPCDPSVDVDLPINEESRRYIKTPPKMWMPSIYRMTPPKSMKQGSAGPMPAEMQAKWTARDRKLYAHILKDYREALRDGMCPEQARAKLPVSTYTSLWCSMTLHSAHRICGLRLDPHAQFEIQEYARATSEIMSKIFPFTWAKLQAGPSRD